MTMPTRRTRKDPRAAATRAALIDMAEAMFADASIDSVSLRQIGAAVGSANTNVVAYYFGSKESLIDAIFQARLPAIEERRAELLAVAEAAGLGNDLVALGHALWQPFYEQTNSTGRHSYAAFLAGLIRSDRLVSRLAFEADMPATTQIVARLEAFTAIGSQIDFRERLQLVATMITGALVIIDRDPQRPSNAALFEEAKAMALAALLAPAFLPARPEG